MAQHNDSDGFAATVASDASSDPRLDDVAIFSTPAVEVVLHWWVESNRRWTERNRQNPLNIDHVVLQPVPHIVAVNSD
jgi:hypothetical protein